MTTYFTDGSRNVLVRYERSATGATAAYWNGTAWVTHDAPGAWTHDLATGWEIGSTLLTVGEASAIKAAITARVAV